MPMPTPDPAARIENYLAALQAGELQNILSLFRADARIFSPLAGQVHPEPFYRQLLAVSGPSQLILRDIALSQQQPRRAYARFDYHWLLADGRHTQFDCIDVFNFDEAGLICQLDIIYDTHQTRQTVADSLSPEAVAQPGSTP